MGKVITSRKEPDVVFIRVFLRGSVAEFRDYSFKIFASLRFCVRHFGTRLGDQRIKELA